MFRLRLVLPGDQQSSYATAGVISLCAAIANLWTFGKYLGRVTVWPAASVLAIYVICGVVGALASANLSMDGVSAGAPAAVCGLLGAPGSHRAWALLSGLSFQQLWQVLVAHSLLVQALRGRTRP